MKADLNGHADARLVQFKPYQVRKQRPAFVHFDCSEDERRLESGRWRSVHHRKTVKRAFAAALHPRPVTRSTMWACDLWSEKFLRAAVAVLHEKLVLARRVPEGLGEGRRRQRKGGDRRFKHGEPFAKLVRDNCRHRNVRRVLDSLPRPIWCGATHQ